MIIPVPLHTIIKVSEVPMVPFFSQFSDIHMLSWRKVGCGITSLAMIINYYKPGAVTVDGLLLEGVQAKAYDTKAGWIHKGLLGVAKKYGLEGASYDLGKLSVDEAFSTLSEYVAAGPVMVSVHYKFNPRSAIPHIVVIDGITATSVYYNDPAAKNGTKEISIADFEKGWKKRLIVIRPNKGERSALA